MKKTILSLLLASAFSAHAAWEITGIQSIDSKQFASILQESDYKKVAQAIKEGYDRAGYPVVILDVNLKNKTIKITEPKVKSYGKYSGYLKNGVLLNSKDLELALLQLKREADLNGEKVTVNINPVSNGFIPVEFVAKKMDDAKMYGGAALFTTLGQRYSGPDVITMYGYGNIGNGQQLEVSSANGLSNLRDESKNGKFNSTSISYKKIHELGTTKLSYGQTEYKTGGKFADLDLNGQIKYIDLLNDYQFSRNQSIQLGLHLKQNSQDVGIIGLNESQKYGYINIGTNYFNYWNGLRYGLNIDLEKGIGGSRDFNEVPLMGDFNPHFTTIKLNLETAYNFENGMLWNGKFGYQNSSSGTPSANSFYIGGPDRGRAYTTGFASMPEGFYLSNVLNFKSFDIKGQSITPYIGYDYAQGKLATGESRKAQSAFIGAVYIPTKDLSFNLVFAKELARDKSLNIPTNRLNITASWNF